MRINHNKLNSIRAGEKEAETARKLNYDLSKNKLPPNMNEVSVRFVIGRLKTLEGAFENVDDINKLSAIKVGLYNLKSAFFTGFQIDDTDKLAYPGETYETIKVRIESFERKVQEKSKELNAAKEELKKQSQEKQLPILLDSLNEILQEGEKNQSGLKYSQAKRLLKKINKFEDQEVIQKADQIMESIEELNRQIESNKKIEKLKDRVDDKLVQIEQKIDMMSKPDFNITYKKTNDLLISIQKGIVFVLDSFEVIGDYSYALEKNSEIAEINKKYFEVTSSKDFSGLDWEYLVGQIRELLSEAMSRTDKIDKSGDVVQ